jgi:hypothetical protein
MLSLDYVKGNILRIDRDGDGYQKGEEGGAEEPFSEEFKHIQYIRNWLALASAHSFPFLSLLLHADIHPRCRTTSQDREHKATMHYGISVLVAVKNKYTMIRIGKLVAASILDNEGSTLEVNRMARRKQKADSKVSMWESYAPRIQKII